MKITFTETPKGWKFYSAVQDDSREYTQSETNFLKSENIPYVIKRVEEFNNDAIEQLEAELNSEEKQK